MDRKLLVKLVSCLPQSRLSQLWGTLARYKQPRFAVDWLKKAFATGVGIDLREAALGMDDFANLEELFVRTLRPGVRPIDPAVGTVVSPVDGTVGTCGTVHDGCLLQVKGFQHCCSWKSPRTMELCGTLSECVARLRKHPLL